MESVESILVKNPCFKSGRKIKVKGLMLHSVGCPQPSAEVFVRNWNKPEASRACVHAFIDGNTGTVYQTLPWEHRAWHGGGSANNTHIGVEMCEPGCLKYTGGSDFICTDRETAIAVVNRTYGAAVELFAFLCRKFDLDPLEDGVIVSHKEGHARGIASGHGDPEHLWNGLQSGFTMDGFRKDVSAALGRVPEQPGVSEQPGTPEQSKQAGVSGQSGASEQSKQAGVSEQPRTPATIREMEVSDRGVALVARYEGCRLEAYKCPAGVWTIGYGHTEGVNPGDRLPSREAAMALLKKDLKKYADHVNACVQKGLITFPLTQNQFDALTSFCYNCGNGNLKKLVTDRDRETVADKLLLYCKGGGKELPGLVKRRKEERALFLGEI